jgi:hypothetical protein
MFDSAKRKKELTEEGREEREGIKIIEREKKLDEILKNVRFFPGSIAEYETKVGYKVKIIDSNGMDMGVIFFEGDYSIYKLVGDVNLKEKLIAEGIESIVRSSRYYTCRAGFPTQQFVYGLPVAKE